MSKLLQALSDIQFELKAPKGQYNSFGKYKYRSCEDIQEALKPLLKENGLVLTMKDELTLIGERYYIKATANLSCMEENESIAVTAYAREEESKKGMDGSQVTGASSSYARKYALNGLFLIDDTRDSDSTNTGENGTAEAKKEYKCSDCGKAFKAHVSKEGNKFTAKEIYEIATKTAEKKGINDGKVRCSQCLDKVIKEKENNA